MRRMASEVERLGRLGTSSIRRPAGMATPTMPEATPFEDLG